MTDVCVIVLSHSVCHLLNYVQCTNISYVPSSLCHGMAILLLLHYSLLLMFLVTGNWSDQLMERVIHP